MTQTSWLFLILAGVTAAIDWWAAETGQVRVEAIAKPAVIIALAGVAVTLDTSSELARWLVLFALACSLVGDVALLRPNRAAWFATGLAAFLVAHVGYIAAMVLGLGVAGLGPALAVAAAVIVAAGFGVVGRRILAAVRASGHR
ncbi:MAG: lysoplasmalogenase family protein, partial [Candidatus Limnocylindrales bacterium]